MTAAIWGRALTDVKDAQDAYRRDGWWRDGTFLDDLARQVRERPSAPALIGYRSADGQTTVVDYAGLARLTDRFAHALLELGVRPGDFVGVQLPDTWELLPIALACLRIGARISPLMPIYRRREIEQMLRLTGAPVYITVAELAGNRPADTVAELAREVPTLRHLVVLGEGGPAGSIPFAGHFLDRADRDSAELEGLAAGPDEPYLILFTSGTTGEPKGALHSPNTLYAAAKGYGEALGLDAGLVMMTPHTLSHYVGLAMGLLGPLLLGGTAVVCDTPDQAVRLELIERHGVTMYYAAPLFVRDLLTARRAAPGFRGELRQIVTGSMPVPPQLVEEVSEVFGVQIHSLWGMTENGPVTFTRPGDPPGWAAHSDGRPACGMEVRIDAPEGEPGPLWVRGPTQCLGYYKREDAYAADLDADGWFNTGDLARDDGRGGIRIAGRTKDVILHRAFNVPVSDIEAVLGRHPKVRDVALIGIPDPSVGELVCAVVTPSGDAPTLAELRDHLRDAGVADWFWPERLELVDAMPRTITGKIRKVELRGRYGGT